MATPTRAVLIRAQRRLLSFKTKLKKSAHVEKNHEGEHEIISRHIHATASALSTHAAKATERPLKTHTHLHVMLVAVSMFAMYNHISYVLGHARTRQIIKFQNQIKEKCSY